MPIRRPVIQHSIRRPMYPGAQINSTPHKITNDVINIEFKNATEAGVRNTRKSTLKCNCRLTLKKLLRHGNCRYKGTKKQIGMQNTPDEANRISYGIENDGEEPEIPENDSLIQMSHINIAYDIIPPEINQERLEMEIENLENMFENVITEFETPENYSNYFGEEIENPVNKPEIDEETEQELQGNDEFKVDYDSEQTIDHAHMLQANVEMLQENEEADVSKPNNKLKIEILEDIVIKHASKSHGEILKTIREIIFLKQGNSSSKVDSTDDVTAQEVFGHNSKVNEEINDGKDKILQANNEMNSKVEGIHNIDPKNNELTTENTSIRSRETEITGDKCNNENTEKAPQFDNFKVPKEVAHSKEKRVKKERRRFVLTHVVGGHIIQESNFAFPIREPQSQKNKPQSSHPEVTVPPIAVQEAEMIIEEEKSKTEEPTPTEMKEEGRVVKEDCITEEVAVVKEDCVTQEPAPIEVKGEEKENPPPSSSPLAVANGEFNPFARLQQSTVKSWTIEDLSHHLLKYDWEETASLLQDNEVDGASLFMVTKTQLMIIGVNEEQADVISEFVQSGSSKEN